MKKQAVAMMLGLSIAATGICAYASDTSVTDTKTLVMGEVTEVDDSGSITVKEITLTGSEDSENEDTELDADSLLQDASDPQYTDTEQTYTLTDESSILWLHSESEEETDSADETEDADDTESDDDAASGSDTASTEDANTNSESIADTDDTELDSSEGTDEELSLSDQLQTAFADTDYILDEIDSDEVYEEDIVLLSVDEDGNALEIAVLEPDSVVVVDTESSADTETSEETE